MLLPANVIAFFFFLLICYVRKLFGVEVSFSHWAQQQSNAFLTACQQVRLALPCCLPPACGIIVSSPSSPIHELNQHLWVVAVLFPLLCSITMFQASMTVTGAPSALSQRCAVRCLFGDSGFWDDELNSPYLTELGMLGQCLSVQIWWPHWARLQSNPGQTDGPRSRSLKPGKPFRMPAHISYPVECPLGKTPCCYSGGSTWL